MERTKSKGVWEWAIKRWNIRFKKWYQKSYGIGKSLQKKILITKLIGNRLLKIVKRIRIIIRKVIWNERKK